jgi:GntR family transcriptional regulator
VPGVRHAGRKTLAALAREYGAAESPMGRWAGGHTHLCRAAWGCPLCSRGQTWAGLLSPNMIVMSGQINFRSPVPVFRQVRDILAAEIESGELPENEPIPSQAALTAEFKVARGTVAKALKTLQSDGTLFLVVGRGLWVSPGARRPKAA